MAVGCYRPSDFYIYLKIFNARRPFSRRAPLYNESKFFTLYCHDKILPFMYDRLLSKLIWQTPSRLCFLNTCLFETMRGRMNCAILSRISKIPVFTNMSYHQTSRLVITEYQYLDHFQRFIESILSNKLN